MKSEENEFPIPAIKRPKLLGMDFYTKILGAPKLVVAPMVDQSELAWRLLCRRHGAQLCYSPMYHSSIFVQDIKYRQQALQSCPEDRPLIIQFCGNDPKIMLEAAILAQDHCDAIDINLGCPQAIAKRGHYGSYLQDEWDLLYDIVNTLHNKLAVPVTCKIRVFEDKQKSIKYAQMLERAGCQLLTVHGRTREQKGPFTGLADWGYVKSIREHLNIPIFANGNILSMEDIDRCLLETGVNGVMTAEGNLHNPAIFERCLPNTWDMANEYLDIAEKWTCPTSYVRGHLFKIFHHLLNLSSTVHLRESMAISHTIEDFRQVVEALKVQFLPYHNGINKFEFDDDDSRLQNSCKSNLLLPPWICQSYIRREPDAYKRMIAQKIALAKADSFNDDGNGIGKKREYYDCDGQQISRKRMKRLRRVNRRPNKLSKPANAIKYERTLEFCSSSVINCCNPLGIKCCYSLCRVCCKEKCFTEFINCPAHKLFQPKKNEVAQKLNSIGNNNELG